MDEVLASTADQIKNFAVIFLVDTSEVRHASRLAHVCYRIAVVASRPPVFASGHRREI
jgi:hypothetical protein